MAPDPTPGDLGDLSEPRLPGVDAGWDAAAASAAADPPPGAKRRPGRPLGSKNKRPLSDAQLAQRRNANANRTKTASTGRTGPTDTQLRDAVANLYAVTGFGVSYADQEIGQTLAGIADTAADAWLHLAQQNPAVRRALVQLTTASSTGELLMAHAPLMALVVARFTGAAAGPIPTEAHETGSNGYGSTGPSMFTAAAGYAG